MVRGGELPDKKYLAFTAGMLLGQLGTGIETFMSHAWGAFVVQIYFFMFTTYGGYKRFRRISQH